MLMGIRKIENYFPIPNQIEKTVGNVTKLSLHFFPVDSLNFIRLRFFRKKTKELFYQIKKKTKNIIFETLFSFFSFKF